MSEFARKLRPHAPLGGVIVSFAIAIVLINPLWETAFSDDWAFAQMSRHLLQTGQYVQNSWLAPNSPLHVYWGTLFMKLGGLSFGSLRFSTLSLMLVTLVSFYFLAKEYGFSSDAGASLTLIILGSPLVLLMSFTFMSDIPFLAFLTLSLLLYSRGIRQENYPLALGGSAAAAASILVRQLGALILPALAVSWMISRERKRLAPLYLTGLLFLLPAILWQVTQPHSWAFRWLTLTQDAYIQSLHVAAPQAVWRVMVTLQYLAFSMPAITLLALVEVAILIRKARSNKSGSHASDKDLWLLILFTLFVLGMSLVGTFAMGERGIFPFVPWNLSGFIQIPQLIPAAVTLLTALGGVALGRIFCLRYRAAQPDTTISAYPYLLDLVTIGLFCVNLIDIQIGDRYFIPLIPYALIISGRFLLPLLNRFRWQVIAISMATLIASALWIRATLSESAAEWKGAEMLTAQGVDSMDIIGTLEWSLYQGHFDTYLESINYALAPESRDGYYFVWRTAQVQKANYRTTSLESEAAEPGWKIIATFPYQDMLLRERQVYVLQRTNGQ